MNKKFHSENCAMCQLLAGHTLPSKYVVVHRFKRSLAVLHVKQCYPGHCELWVDRHACELFELSPGIRKEYLEELNTLAQAVYDVCQPRKLNYELLGNVIPHMHWHVIPRYEGDPLPLKPIWENPEYTQPSKRTFMSTQTKKRLAGRIADEIKKLQR